MKVIPPFEKNGTHRRKEEILTQRRKEAKARGRTERASDLLDLAIQQEH